MRNGMAVLLVASGCMTIAVSNIPPPPECKAGAEAKSAMDAQQGTIEELSGLLDKTVETVKKSADSLSQACRK